LDASQFLSSRLVPEEPSKIARRFNAGKDWKNVASRRDGRNETLFSVVPAGLMAISSHPGVKTPGYFQNVPLGQSACGCLKIEMRPQRFWNQKLAGQKLKREIWSKT
jgi:hypothetical protein